MRIRCGCPASTPLRRFRSAKAWKLPSWISRTFPVTSTGGEWEIVQGLEVSEFSRGKIDASVAELAEERDAVTELGLI